MLHSLQYNLSATSLAQVGKVPPIVHGYVFKTSRADDVTLDPFSGTEKVTLSYMYDI